MALYHDTDNGPVEVKKHQIMGANGYTLVGSPTITDGVLTPTTDVNTYVKADANLTFNSNSDLEIYCRFKTNAEISSNNTIAIIGDSVATSKMFCYYYSGWIYFLSLAFNNYTWRVVQPNTWYRVKLTAKNGVWNSYVYDDNENLLGELQSTPTPFGDVTVTIPFGKAPGYANGPVPGGIDLNNTYIKVNGDLWFYQPQETKYIIRENPSTQEQHLVYAKPNMYLAGPANYSVVGSPTIEDCDLTVFGAGNYIELPSINLFSENSFEYVITLQIGDNYPKGTLAEFPIDDPGGTPVAGGLYIWGNAGQGTMNGGISSSDTDIEAYPVLKLNTKYAFRFKKENGVYTTAWRENDGAWQQLTTDNGANKTTNSTSRPIHIGTNATTGMRFLLNETYCITNDTLWFYGKNYSSKNIAPVPSGFTYGSTTTNAIGYVDMRTQAFTAAPAGTGYNEVPVMPSGGIDEHTLYLWPCDSDLKDTIGGTTALKGTLNTTYHKFGEGSIKNSSSTSQSTASISGFSDTADWTIDYWVYVNSNTNGNNTVGFIGCCLDFRNGKIQNESGNNKWGTSFSEDISLQTWHHVAVVYDYSHSEIRVYLDGHKIATSAINISGYSNFGSITVWSFGPTLYIDEIRLSDTVRYTADFTVPTQPYS